MSSTQTTFSDYRYLEDAYRGVFGTTAMFDQLMSWYDGGRDRRRWYHTAGHVARCVRDFRDLLAEPGMPETGGAALVSETVGMAALLFHDACYQIESSTCEVRSANLFDRYAFPQNLWAPGTTTAEFRAAVREAIQATDHLAEGPPRVLSPTAALVADADMLFLARSERWELLAYEDAVRAEYDDYAASLLPGAPPPPDYYRRRSRVLGQLLDRIGGGLLFKNELVSQRYTRRAERNLSYLLGVVEARGLRRETRP